MDRAQPRRKQTSARHKGRAWAKPDTPPPWLGIAEATWQRPWLLFERWRLPRLPEAWDAALGAQGWLWLVLLSVIPVVYVGFALTVGVSSWGTPGNSFPWIDYDFWWHLSTGNLILRSGRIPAADPFLYTYGKEWVAHEWLAELLMAWVYQVGRYPALLLLTWVTAAAGYWAMICAARWYGLSRRGCVLLTVLWFGSYLRGSLIMVRPQMWSFSVLAVMLAAIAAYDTGRIRRLWPLVPLFALWANFHLSVFFGLLCLGTFCLDRLVHRRLDRHLAVVGTLCALALLANPWGAELLAIPLRYQARHPFWEQRVFEWQPPDLSDPVSWPFALAMLAAVPALWQLLRLRLWPALPLLLVLYQSLHANRFIALYVLLAFELAAWLVWQHGRERPAQAAVAADLPARRWLPAAPLLAAVMVVWVSASAPQSQLRHEPFATGYPVTAADLVLQDYPHARIFNTYDFGGYLTYRFGGEPKVFIDGRNEMYGDALLDDYVRIIDGRLGWRQALRRWQVDTVIVRHIDGLSRLLKNNSDWRLVHEDDQVVMYRRNT